ncbi:MAG: hypothetical protein RLZZ301_190 [Bacteroidota bacterium]|jgi:phosphoglycerol transferase MdoB-like AlkP superfamily enzyme
MRHWIRVFWDFFPTLLAFFVLQVLVQLLFLVQLDATNSSAVFLSSFLELVFLTCVYGLCFVGLATLVPRMQKFLQKMAAIVLFLQVIGSICCDQYFIYAHEVLDEALLLFDWKELLIIADLDHRLNGYLLLLLLVSLLLPWLLIRLFRHLPRTESQRSAIFSISALFVGALAFYVWNAPQLSANRFSYFMGRVGQILIQGKQQADAQQISPKAFNQIAHAFYNGGEPIDPVYPCLHALPKNSQLQAFFKRSSNGKAPNICIVIVESMSSDLFGERGANTGVLMPFLDSLSRQSIYFPNAFSTYQRTHNVLPAVLASVPNTVNGNVFQQIPFPRHFSLFNLLKASYSFRFNCGVPYSYLNMSGFMKHYNKVQLLQRWDTQRQQHKEAVGSAWGYPDEDLFAQAQDALACAPASKKSLLSLYLTISSHDPFVYPNKEKWTRFVESKAARIKNATLKKLIASQAASFGSFSYVDSCLKVFFEKEQQTARFQNTIYLITGDHGTELYRRNALSKYNVPLLLYSPLLKRPFQSNAVVSHNDIAPTLLNYLKSAYQLTLPEVVPFVGKELELSTQFKARRQLIFTTNKLTSTELMDDSVVLLQNRLYQLNKQLEIVPFKQAKRHRSYQKQLNAFQLLSQYTILQNHLVDSVAYEKWVGRAPKLIPLQEIRYRHRACKKEMTYLGTHTVSFKKGVLRIEVQASTVLPSRNKLDELPTLVLQAKRTKYLSKKWTINRKVRPHLILYDARKHTAIVRYAFDFDPKAVQLKSYKGALSVFLLRENALKSSFKKLRLNFLNVLNN